MAVGRRKAAHDTSYAPKWKSSESALSQRSDTRSKSSTLSACCMLPELRDPRYLDVADFEDKSDQASPWSIAPIDSRGCCPVVQIPGVSYFGEDFFPLSLDHLIPMIEYSKCDEPHPQGSWLTSLLFGQTSFEHS